MQKRYFPNKDGYRMWLTPQEAEQLVDVYRGDVLERTFAMMAGLHGLRSEEIMQVTPGDFTELDDGRWKLHIPVGKRHRRRDLPVSADLQRLASYSSATSGESVVQQQVSDKRSLRDWMQSAREQLAETTGNADWEHVSLHDLRRSWATQCFYTLAYDGNPIAENLTMSWGGWKQTASGRQTFREKYLGPVPDWITVDVMDELRLPS